MGFMKYLIEKTENDQLVFHLGRARRDEEYEWGQRNINDYLEEIEKRKASGNWDISDEEYEKQEHLGFIQEASIEELEEMKEGLRVSGNLGVYSPEVQKAKEEAVDQLLSWKKERAERKRKREERALRKKEEAAERLLEWKKEREREREKG